MIARKTALWFALFVLVPGLASAETRRVKITWEYAPEEERSVSGFRVYISPVREEVVRREGESLIYETEKKCVCFYLPDDEEEVYVGVTAFDFLGQESEVGIVHFNVREGRLFPGIISGEECDFCEEGGPTVSFVIKGKH